MQGCSSSCTKGVNLLKQVVFRNVPWAAVLPRVYPVLNVVHILALESRPVSINRDALDLMYSNEVL